jgi:hypothetical protein
MASKSTATRRANRPKKVSPAVEDNVDEAMEDSLAYQRGFLPDEEEAGAPAGYLQQASNRIRELTYDREGRVVVGALAAGFVIGAAIGCVIAGARERNQSWSDRLACEGLGRRLLDRISSRLPESLTEKLHRG